MPKFTDALGSLLGAVSPLWMSLSPGNSVSSSRAILSHTFHFRWSPSVQFHVHAALRDLNAFGFEEFALERGIRLADEDSAPSAENAMPGYPFAAGSGAHSAPRRAGTALQAHSLSYGPIC
jgi:hypothetical protein